MKLENVRARLIAPMEVVTVDGETLHAKGQRLLVLQLGKSEAYEGREFVKWVLRENTDLSLSLKKYRRPRSIAQNRLLWALLAIMSVEVYGKPGWEEALYQDVLDLYAPREVSRLTKKPRIITSSRMDAGQMSRLIEGVFRELAEMGVSVDAGPSIRHYWIEWAQWRWSKGDPLAGSYESEAEYKVRVPFCEACLSYLGEGGHMAHIMTRGSGGGSEDWNLLHLCAFHHVWVQHQQGWAALFEDFPHVAYKVERAREQAGRGAVVLSERQPQEPEGDLSMIEWTVIEQYRDGSLSEAQANEALRDAGSDVTIGKAEGVRV